MVKKCIQHNRFLKSVSVSPQTGITYVDQLPLQKVKDYLIVSHDDDDAMITGLIDSVCAALSDATKRPYIPSDIVFYMEVNKADVLLPRLPIASITTVSKRTGSNTYEDLTSDQYEFLGDSLILEETGIMVVTYSGGYAIGELPNALEIAALAEIAYRYENRGDKAIAGSFCATADAYIANYIVPYYI